MVDSFTATNFSSSNMLKKSKSEYGFLNILDGNPINDSYDITYYDDIHFLFTQNCIERIPDWHIGCEGNRTHYHSGFIG